ncbi:ABC transporter ATP-binding protein [Desulfuromonas versatilis]|uniref:ABC transporter ATP-binding protein n=1 Tax=Desulfuromonas versatilis TaxID=2802975 RepID=A0ABN6E2K3_9BACT|nr:ABC transporter ATP-binding protein [Desulfuromonas versatilis]BCR06563.1 ABC transporter ATP-binding protein [Desulfuromonas versatilis]
MESTILIDAAGVSKIHNRGKPDEVAAVRDASLRVRRGETLVLKGPSGSGKTSLLSLVGCMARPSAGRILVEGRDVAKLPERFLTEVRRSTFGFIFQQFNLVRDLSVQDNVLLPLFPLDTRLAEMRRRAAAVLEKLSLAGKSQRKVRQLSGGEQQRVAIARALINNPRILVADEPTAHLDSRLAADLLDILSGLKAEGKTILIATHDPYIFEHPLVDRSIEMHDGRIAGAATP